MVSRALWWDGVFELALGCVLSTAPLTGLMSMLAFPPPASPGLVVGFGLLLIPVGLWLLVLSRRWSAGIVAALGIVNAAGGVLFGVWLGAGWGGFSILARLITAGTALALALLGAGELVGLRFYRPR